MITSLPILPFFFLAIAGWFLLHFFIRWSSGTFSGTYRALSVKDRSDWECRMIAGVHATAAAILAYPVLCDGLLLASQITRVYGENEYAQKVMAVSASYFVWDLYVSVKNFEEYGWGFTIHALLCMAVFGNALRPFLLYYGGVFLMYEATGPWVSTNIVFPFLRRNKQNKTQNEVNGKRAFR